MTKTESATALALRLPTIRAEVWRQRMLVAPALSAWHRAFQAGARRFASTEREIDGAYQAALAAAGNPAHGTPEYRAAVLPVSIRADQARARDIHNVEQSMIKPQAGLDIVACLAFGGTASVGWLDWWAEKNPAEETPEAPTGDGWLAVLGG